MLSQPLNQVNLCSMDNNAGHSSNLLSERYRGQDMYLYFVLRQPACCTARSIYSKRYAALNINWYIKFNHIILLFLHSHKPRACTRLSRSASDLNWGDAMLIKESKHERNDHGHDYQTRQRHAKEHFVNRDRTASLG
jgi:hypothetical protein